MTYTLSLTITREDNSQDYDFCHVAADSTQEAIESHTRILNNRMEKGKAGNINFKGYANWKSFELQAS